MGFRTGFGNHNTVKMIIFRRFDDLRNHLAQIRSRGLSTGFVPTMGALHPGHISLIGASRAMGAVTICSIFVNPRQFNDPKDYQKYPVSTEKDIAMLERAGVEILFLPAVDEVYPPGVSIESYALGDLETRLEGKYRPGHYQGVCQVMSRLLKIVLPDHLFMGQKDFQQCLVVMELIRQLQLRVAFHMVPTLREADGLAMSSRNSRLDPVQRQNAVAISRALGHIREGFAAGNSGLLLAEAQAMLDAAAFRTEYIAVARTSDLRPLDAWDGKEKAIVLVAAFQGDVRLIDNMLLN
jgi:pantoate--beta-alanine ligase